MEEGGVSLRASLALGGKVISPPSDTRPDYCQTF